MNINNARRIPFIIDRLQELEDSPATAITDGIVITALNENGQATAVDVYGTQLQYYMFGRGAVNYDYPWSALETVNFINNDEITILPKGLFRRCTTLRGEFNFPNVENGTGGFGDGSGLEGTFQATLITSLSIGKLQTVPPLLCNSCSALKTVSLPYAKICTNGGYQAFGSCTALETCELGSIGHPLTEIDKYTFDGTTQSGLTITIYTTSAYADTALTNIRNGATNATIKIYAAEDTTYDGDSYAAGELLLTSEV